jgi:hypothetical protein
VLIGLLVGGCVSAPQPTPHSAAASSVDLSARVILVRRRWHVDVGFAREDLSPALTPLLAHFSDARYLLFGFGDRHYLLARERGASTLLGALLPGAGLMLLTALHDSPQTAFGSDDVVELAVSAEERNRLERFVRDSLSGTDNPVPLAAGPYSGSRYFDSPQRYSGLHTCNTWVAEALRAGGLPVRSTAVVFAGQIWRQIHELARARPVAPARASTASAAGRLRTVGAHGGGTRARRHDHGRIRLGRLRVATADTCPQQGQHGQGHDQCSHGACSRFPTVG